MISDTVSSFHRDYINSYIETNSIYRKIIQQKLQNQITEPNYRTKLQNEVSKNSKNYSDFDLKIFL
jgi:hypothetical protein